MCQGGVFLAHIIVLNNKIKHLIKEEKNETYLKKMELKKN